MTQDKVQFTEAEVRNITDNIGVAPFAYLVENLPVFVIALNTLLAEKQSALVAETRREALEEAFALGQKIIDQEHSDDISTVRAYQEAIRALLPVSTAAAGPKTEIRFNRHGDPDEVPVAPPVPSEGPIDAAVLVTCRKEALEDETTTFDGAFIPALNRAILASPWLSELADALIEAGIQYESDSYARDNSNYLNRGPEPVRPTLASVLAEREAKRK